MRRHEAWIGALALLAACCWLAGVWMSATGRPDWREHCEAYRERIEAHGANLECLQDGLRTR